MQKIITPDDLLLYAFNEASEELRQEINSHLAWDTELRSELQKILALKKGLNRLHKQPSKMAVNNVKSFAAAYKVMDIKSNNKGIIAN